MVCGPDDFRMEGFGHRFMSDFGAERRTIEMKLAGPSNGHNDRSMTFIVGGARSGKSCVAEKLAVEFNLPVTYDATAQVRDAEFAKRIAAHQRRRPPKWKLLEIDVDLAGALAKSDAPGHC